MLQTNPFIDEAGRLRSFWRALVFLLLSFAALGIIVAQFSYVLVMFWGEPRTNRFLDGIGGFVVQATLTFGVMLATGYLCGKYLEKLSFRAFGLWFHKGWARDLAWGTVVGALSLALATVIAAAGGFHVHLHLPDAPGRVLLTLLLSSVAFVWFALAEEVWFRGYALQTLTRAGYVAVGLLLTSVPFALAHLQNPNVSLFYTFTNTTLAGVWLGLGYWRTRSLWFPLGLHWAWNWTMGAFLGLPVSGITEIAPHPLLQTQLAGPSWLTGGAYGIEGGVACTTALLLSSLFVWRTRLVATTDEVAETQQPQQVASNLLTIL